MAVRGSLQNKVGRLIEREGQLSGDDEQRNREKIETVKRTDDINFTPWDEINALPDFILKKMYSSEEFSNRKRAAEMLGGEKVKNFRQIRR